MCSCIIRKAARFDICEYTAVCNELGMDRTTWINMVSWTSEECVNLIHEVTGIKSCSAVKLGGMTNVLEVTYGTSDMSAITLVWAFWLQDWRRVCYCCMSSRHRGQVYIFICATQPVIANFVQQTIEHFTQDSQAHWTVLWVSLLLTVLNWTWDWPVPLVALVLQDMTFKKSHACCVKLS